MAEIHVIGELTSGSIHGVPSHVHLCSRMRICAIDDETWIPLNAQALAGSMHSLSCKAEVRLTELCLMNL